MEDECSIQPPACTQSNQETKHRLCPGLRVLFGKYPVCSVLCMGGGGNLAKGQWHLGEGSDRFLQLGALSHKANGGVAMEPAERRMQNRGITASQKGLV